MPIRYGNKPKRSVATQKDSVAIRDTALLDCQNREPQNRAEHEHVSPNRFEGQCRVVGKALAERHGGVSAVARAAALGGECT